MRTTLALAAVLALTASSAFAATAPRCHDAKGRFTKCPMAATMKPAAKCRDAKGHFAKCGAPGTHPA